MRHLIVKGHRIYLLPEDKGRVPSCPRCRKCFNRGTNRPCEYQVCRHLTCLECVTSSLSGCKECGKKGKEKCQPVSEFRPHACFLCNKASFAKKSLLGMHFRHEHGSEVYVSPRLSRKGPLECFICELPFEQNPTSMLQKTVVMKCRHSSCLSCFIFSKGCTQCETEPPEPEDISMGFIKSEALQEEAECPLCSFTFSRLFGLVRHITRNHGDVVSPVVRKHACGECYLKYERLPNSNRREVAYQSCNHSCCLKCAIINKLVCQQCQPQEPSSQTHLSVSSAESSPVVYINRLKRPARALSPTDSEVEVTFVGEAANSEKTPRPLRYIK